MALQNTDPAANRVPGKGRAISGGVGVLLIVTLAVFVGACGNRRVGSSGNDPAAVPPGFVVARPVAPLFEPAEAHTLLEGPKRDRWQKPADVVRALDLRAGETVADIGAGSGYLTPYLSRAVGPKGTVYAQEIQDEFLPLLRRRAKTLPNVRVVRGVPTDPRLPGRANVFVLLTVYHEVDHPVDFLRTLRLRYARPGARLAVIDFDAGRSGDPPAPAGHQVAESAVIAEARAAGWELDQRHEFLSRQFFLVFRPRRRPDSPGEQR